MWDVGCGMWDVECLMMVHVNNFAKIKIPL
jgi:hypothetical protein